MRIRKITACFCMALGLTMAAPFSGRGHGNTAGTVSGTTQDTQTTNATGWHYNANGSRYYTINNKKRHRFSVDCEQPGKQAALLF